uniref:PDZ and LIM domain protein 2 n=1 Tax=Geotrypetes seraphini TaxID=260995 RepID=A0A6P8RLL7_GEOSA|nr:PDZ and LIM domain protein 2 [Geotrypetes seraphini]XP_033806212.1 PDZ and LIM domain protein 2 [Geotrypetes seraphini]XP_033806215.1 PDZ and LIM domain protein 2 [Geotrypetes seraphini]XP_033806216.1 PDZ and LIM domain protein 2 [Geotrypetes seraphini]XP_033806217.1 PDZ and LIM domain protein 2 [Geotrypetes seraphini]XP_033806218.1 PDZ and LIM domain protein 2 [Geotrypetes seraphini]XP_033806219.1 PDZ and LIM domain protein 2 [Geotrypetes seraphini]XP_033806220.1 PDZ and LIM domain prote
MMLTLNLVGPAPWGFRITGGKDFNKPITVSKVSEGSKAATADLQPGDVIVFINGESTEDMLNVEAQNRIKCSSSKLQLSIERQASLTPNRDVASHYQDTFKAGRHESWSPQESRYSSQGSNSPRSSSPFSSPAVKSRPYSPHEERMETAVMNRSVYAQGSPLHLGQDRTPSPTGLKQDRVQEGGSYSRREGSPVFVLPPSPTHPGVASPRSLQNFSRLSPMASNRQKSTGSDPGINRFEEDSEVYKMLQENRETRAPPRQSSSFRILQEALESEGPDIYLPSCLSPNVHKPVSSTVHNLHICEKCGSSIVNQAVKIQENHYRHSACYVCSDCGLNLKMRGHFWVGDTMYCEKHARARYRGPEATVPSAPSQP